MAVGQETGLARVRYENLKLLREEVHDLQTHIDTHVVSTPMTYGSLIVVAIGALLVGITGEKGWILITGVPALVTSIWGSYSMLVAENSLKRRSRCRKEYLVMVAAEEKVDLFQEASRA